MPDRAPGSTGQPATPDAKLPIATTGRVGDTIGVQVWNVIASHHVRSKIGVRRHSCVDALHPPGLHEFPPFSNGRTLPSRG